MIILFLSHPPQRYGEDASCPYSNVFKTGPDWRVQQFVKYQALREANASIGKYIAKPSSGQSSGLICIWDKNVLKCSRIIEGANYVGQSGLWGLGETEVNLLNIYAPCDVASRRALWEELRIVVRAQSGSWCLMGDFNSTRKQNERTGDRGTTTGMEDFEKFIIELELVKMLTAPFTEEVKNAVWNVDASKAPRPDGFNFKFFKELWETVKDDLMGAQEFHRNGKLVAGLNASSITLLPKSSNPQKIEEYRPISLIGALYKIIAKLLANRLTLVISEIIREYQMAFIKGRQLCDAVVMENEIIDEAKRMKRASFFLKIDFEKAYDKVCWRFLDYMLLRMGFGETWRGWIRECLQTSLFLVLVNGSPTRQEDLLSPFLFLIVVEGLNGLISLAIDRGLFQGVEVGSNGVRFSHIQFADDTILFGHATESNIWATKCILRTFELVSRLKINYAKSHLIGVHVQEEWNLKMACLLNCNMGETPFKYLEVQVGGNHRRLAMWQSLVDSFKKKLSMWKGRWLSLGGRITLLNFALTSLPMFLLSVYLAPKSIVKPIEKIKRDFLWGGCEGNRKIHSVSWERICRNKKKGGLGVKDIRSFNLALLGKWWDKLAKGEEGLWFKLIKEKYGCANDNWHAWVMEGRGWVLTGEKTFVGEGVLASRFPRLFMLSTGMDHKIIQMGSWQNGKWCWQLQWQCQLLSWELESVDQLTSIVEATHLHQGKEDIWTKKHGKEGVYSTKSRYSLLVSRQDAPSNHVFERVWNPCVPTKFYAVQPLKKITHLKEEFMHYFTGQPLTTIPLAVGHAAKSQCSPFVPHQVTLIFSNPTTKYKATAMKATPASRAAERM
ncbi:hypothetical protein SLEP1_g58708 [Rubroshorea leprosula]|uniref:Reverse transcriptase domain-containing protein n=1 Tax=Rubroshorea leprosula TaxID=152421 RepID=A0AAV5MTF9_9ROSI|nr:hypothetical protein SLEP1_g58708 [Rubroshorea leprosula]